MLIAVSVWSLAAICISVIAYGIVHDMIDASRREKERLERE